MDIVYLLLPVVLLLVVIIIVVFFWAVKSDQFEDLEGPAYKVFMDDEKPVPENNEHKDTEHKQ